MARLHRVSPAACSKVMSKGLSSVEFNCGFKVPDTISDLTSVTALSLSRRVRKRNWLVFSPAKTESDCNPSIKPMAAAANLMARAVNFMVSDWTLAGPSRPPQCNSSGCETTPRIMSEFPVGVRLIRVGVRASCRSPHCACPFCRGQGEGEGETSTTKGEQKNFCLLKEGTRRNNISLLEIVRVNFNPAGRQF